MATNQEVANLQNQQKILGQEANALRKQYLGLPDGPERDALKAQWEAKKAEISTVQTQVDKIAPNDPATSTYEGPDRNSGQNVYVNPVTGLRYTSDATPTTEQKKNSVTANGDPVKEEVNQANQQGTAGYPTPPDAKSAQQLNADIKTVNTPTPQTVDTNTAPEVPKATVGPAIASNTVTSTTLPPQADPEVEYYQKLQAENEAAAVSAPLKEPPAGDNEFAGLDTAVEANANSLQEPPVLNEAETNAYLAAIPPAPEPAPVTSQEVLNSGPSTLSINAARSSGALAQAQNSASNLDWRLKIKLASGAKYFYNSAKQSDLMWPLRTDGGTDGVVFPYTPNISMNYRSYYEVSDLIHTNYKQYFYKNSSVEEITITADFTAQDTQEANYILAVMTFFKSVTKMFYGQDGTTDTPINGTPPPLCYMLGYGQFQFSNHPVLISSFQYSLPNDVDYIRAGTNSTISGDNLSQFNNKTSSAPSGFAGIPGLSRLFGSGLQKGGVSKTPTFNVLSNPNATYVPTKIQFIINAIPIVTRGAIAKEFSLKDYATGQLIKKGIW